MITVISECCGAGVGKGHYTEYPLGGKTYGITYATNVCEECGKEAYDLLEVYCCDNCGEVSQYKMMVNPAGDEICDTCVMVQLERIKMSCDKMIANLQDQQKIGHELMELSEQIKTLEVQHENHAV